MTMTMAEMWMEKGGVAALSETALLLLIQKFGKIPKHIKDDIMNADMATLKVVLFNILRYESVEDVQKYL